MAMTAFCGLVAGCSSGQPPRAGGPTTTRVPGGPASTAVSSPAPSAASTTRAPTSSTAPAGGGGSCLSQGTVASWTLSRRAALLVVVPVLGADPQAVAVATTIGAGGVLLLGTQPGAQQLAAELRPLRRSSPPSPLVMVDQEGGGVQRLGSAVDPMPWPRQMAATMTTGAVQALARRVGTQMLSLGIDVDLAPVLDLDGGASLSASDPDGPRSFSVEPSIAAAYGLAFMEGMEQGGVTAVVKHFPGLGGATGNTDYGPAATRPYQSLQSAGLLPFEQAIRAGVKAVMVANATVPGLTTQPASLSSVVISDLLRQRLHFSGLVMTDSLSAGAITAAGYTVATASVAAIEAGADMVLFGSTLTPADSAALGSDSLAGGTEGVVDAIAGAARTGAIPQSRLDQAVLHVLAAEGAQVCGAS